MDVKLAAVVAARDSSLSVAEICRRAGISRDSFYEAKRRFDGEGVSGLLPRSRRPHRSPNRTPAAMEEAIVRARKELDDGFDNGARSIRFHLIRKGLNPPTDATIHRVLQRHGLVEPQPNKRPRSATRRFEFPNRNSCWQLDGAQWRLADGTTVAIMGVIDDHSRRCRHRAGTSENSSDVWACFLSAVKEFGLPTRLLTDNGMAMNTTRRGWQSTLTANLVALGVQPINSSFYHPQTCGKRERLNGTLKRWLRARPPATTMDELAEQLTQFDTAYNNRPHQSLGGATPNERWQQSTDPDPVLLPAPPVRISTVKVSTAGVIALPARRTAGIGRSWAGVSLTVIIDNLNVAVFHDQDLIRQFDIDPTRQHQPTGKPRGGPRQPRILLSTQ